MLLKHALFNLATLINQLLLSFDLRAHDIKFGVFLAQSIVTHFELLVQLALDQRLSLSLTLCLQHLQSFIVVLADLLRRLLLIIKLLLVHFVLSSEKSGQFGSALL